MLSYFWLGENKDLRLWVQSLPLPTNLLPWIAKNLKVPLARVIMICNDFHNDDLLLLE